MNWQLDSYHKTTDNKQYLHFKSAHPRKQKESVSHGLDTRCKRICKTTNALKRKMPNLSTN